MAEPLRRRSKELHWALAKVAKLAVQPLDLHRTQLVETGRHGALIAIGLEQILGHLSFLALLKVTEDQVDPFGQLHGHRVGLEGHA